MRALCILVVATALGILAAGCDGSGSLVSVPSPSSTPYPLDALRDRAEPLCAAAVAGTAPRGTGAPATPIASYWRQDDSGLERAYQNRDLKRTWTAYTGVTYEAGPGYENEFLTGFTLARVEDVRTIVCIHERWIGAGTYETSGTLGVRKDWTAYILSWPDGAVLTTRTVRGGDPPATRTTGGGQGGCSVCTEPGKPPAREVHTWLHSLLDGPPATATAAPVTATATAQRTATASPTATRTPSPASGASTVPGCTLCGVHSLPNGGTLEVRANAYEGWSTSADGRELTLRLKEGATARVQGATCTNLDPRTVRCTLTPGNRVIADGAAP